MSAPHGLGRHLALAGFMGSGKTRAGGAAAARTGRPFLDLDEEIEKRAGASVQELFAARGEAGFRVLEGDVARDVLAGGEPLVVALGGGAVLSERTRSLLAARAFTVLLDVDPETAWQRVARFCVRDLLVDGLPLPVQRVEVVLGPRERPVGARDALPRSLGVDVE